MVVRAVFIIISCTWYITSAVSPLYLERGSVGVVPCPAMKECGYSPDQTEAIYWSFSPKGSLDPPRDIIAYYHGETKAENGQYKIIDSSLVISNVTQLSEGKYSYLYKPWYNPNLEGTVEVFEKVSCKEKWPKVADCSRDQPACKVSVPSNETDFPLTCSVYHTKPPVITSLFQWSSNKWEEINSTTKIDLFFCNVNETDCFSYNNTFNSTSTVKVRLNRYNTTFKCASNSSTLNHTVITVTKNAFVGDPGSDMKITEVPTISGTSERPLLISVGLVLSFLIGVCFGTGVLISYRRIASKKKNKKKTKPDDLKMECTEIEKCIPIQNVSLC